MIIKLIQLSIIVTLSLSTMSRAEVNVARTFSTHVFGEAVNVGAGQYWIYPLPGTIPGDVYQVGIGTGNAVWRDISAFVMDEENLDRFKAGMQFRAQGRSKGITPFQFEATRPGTDRLYLVLDNRYALFITKKASVAVKLSTQLPDGAAQDLEKRYSALYGKLKESFVFKDFDINVRPCGQVNATSAQKTGDITICTELLSQYANKPSVVIFVFAHEIGHTLLGLWGLPGADNEDMADEFASNLITQSKDGARIISESLDFFKDRNPYAEAKQTIEQGDRHSLSIQRIRNIRAHLEQPKALTGKWNRLLYPHLTESALNKIITSPDQFDDIALAKAELSKRSGNTEPPVTTSTNTTSTSMGGCSKDTDCKGERICEQGQCIWPSETSDRTFIPSRAANKR